MATGTYAPDPFEQYCDDDGNPLSNGSLSVYAAGTSTPVNTYSDVNLTTPNTNPVNLDAAGRPESGAIFLTPGVSYKFILEDSLGATIATRDNIAAVPLSPNLTGTWVPVIGGSTSTTGQSYTLQTGSYVKLGTLVMAFYNVTLSAKGTIVGNVQLQGLPFAAAANAANPIPTWIGATTSFVHMSGVIVATNTAFFVEGITAAATSSASLLVTADISNTFQLVGCFIYTASS